VFLSGCQTGNPQYIIAIERCLPRNGYAAFQFSLTIHAENTLSTTRAIEVHVTRSEGERERGPAEQLIQQAPIDRSIKV